MAKMKKSNRRFLLGMLIYAIVFITFAAAALCVLDMYLTEYEQTRPNNVITRYMSGITEESIRSAAKDTVDSLNHALMSEDECYKFLYEQIDGAQTAKATTESNAEQTVYYVQRDGRTLGRIVLTASGKTRFGFPNWRVGSAEFDFEQFCGEKSVTVPENYSVSCGGTELERGTERRELELLHEFYGYGQLDLPYLVDYSTGRYIKEPELTVLKPDGTQYTGDYSEASFTDNCTDEQKAAVQSFVEQFLTAYIKYTSNVDKNAANNFNVLAQYIVPGSMLYERLYGAMTGLTWANSFGDTLSGIEYSSIMDVGSGYYVCVLEYDVDTYGGRGLVTTHNNIKLLLTQSDSGLLAQVMYSF